MKTRIWREIGKRERRKIQQLIRIRIARCLSTGTARKPNTGTIELESSIETMKSALNLSSVLAEWCMVAMMMLFIPRKLSKRSLFMTNSCTLCKFVTLVLSFVARIASFRSSTTYGKRKDANEQKPKRDRIDEKTQKRNEERKREKIIERRY